MKPARIDDALSELEHRLEPTVSRLLDQLIDNAALAKPGLDGAARAESLKAAARHVGGLASLLEKVGPLVQAAPRRMSA